MSANRLVRWDATPAEWNEALLKAGALGYLAKPIEPRRVVEEVRRFLGDD